MLFDWTLLIYVIFRSCFMVAGLIWYYSTGTVCTTGLFTIKFGELQFVVSLVNGFWPIWITLGFSLLPLRFLYSIVRIVCWVGLIVLLMISTAPGMLCLLTFIAGFLPSVMVIFLPGELSFLISSGFMVICLCLSILSPLIVSIFTTFSIVIAGLKYDIFSSEKTGLCCMFCTGLKCLLMTWADWVCVFLTGIVFLGDR